MKKKVGIVVTTIFEPLFLKGYCNNLKKYDQLDNTTIYIITDYKTPQSCFKIVDILNKKYNFIKCMTIEEQVTWLNKFQNIEGIIPFNSDNRRNVGFLKALEDGVDILISIDDDNYCLPDEDFVGNHSFIGEEYELYTVKSKNNWVNICKMLEYDSNVIIYPRGFPYSRRWKDSFEIKYEKMFVALNAGLWLGDPDVDAVTRLTWKWNINNINSKYPYRIGLKNNTWSPINTQNTSLIRSLIPAYYYIPMNAEIGDLKIDRYGDIWSGFFVKKVIESLDWGVTFGKPVVTHNRTTHNLLKDLSQEFWGMMITEELIDILESIRIKKNNISDSYLEIFEILIEKAPSYKLLSKKVIFDYLKQMKYNANIWVKTCNIIGV